MSHEIVRHRLASYSQESTRYCDYDKGEIIFIQPCWFKNDLTEFDPDSFDTLVIGEGIGRIKPHPEMTWVRAMQYIESMYRDLREFGWKPEQARSVLPNSLKTEIVMTMNLREWRHFFKLRTAKAAHPQMREIAIPMLQAFKNIIPIIFDDIEVID